MVSLPSQTGNGAKPLIIVAVLVVLIGVGIWAISAMDKKESEGAAQVEPPKEKPKAKPKPRKKVKTAIRPEKSEMATLTMDDLEKFKENVGKWVWLQGKITSGNDAGLLEFDSPNGVTAQLVRGKGTHLTGKHVKVIAWLVSEKSAQVDGTFDITVLEAGDLMPDKSIYTTDDVDKLISLRTSKATFEGKVTGVRSDKEKKTLVIEFEGDSAEFYGEAKVEDLDARDISEEDLKKLIGKTIRLKGKVGHKKVEEKDRITFTFRDEEDYETVD